VNLLAVEGLSKSFGGVEAVSDVSLTLERGQLLALIGPNGAGKSTCFNLLNGQLRPDRGRVLLDGTDITGQAPSRIWRRGVGRTFQVAAVFGSMTLRENVQMALMSRHGESFRLSGAATRRHRGQADDLLHLVGMAPQAERAANLLAYGDSKRLELALALAGAPKLLLMDEPTAGMAPAERVTLMALSARIAREQGIGVLFTEHSMDVVFTHADQIMVLARGRRIAFGPPASVRDDPQVREVYLGAGVFAALPS
jgi:branched-chain amino acid transport system ATP-binding protein